MMITEEEIKKLARAIWEAEGCPEGRDCEHYFRARRMLEEKERVTLNMERLAWLMTMDKGRARHVQSSAL